MSEYQNVVGGRLKLKGKALDVKEGGVKKKKNRKHQLEVSSQIEHDELHKGENSDLPTDPNNELTEADKMGDEVGNPHPDYDHLTAAERRYMEQKQKINMQKMAKVANKSHMAGTASRSSTSTSQTSVSTMTSPKLALANIAIVCRVYPALC